MTLISQIISDAFRQDNILGVGAVPTTPEQTEALGLLNNIVLQMVGSELGELVYDWQVPPAATAPYRREDPRDPYGDNAIPATYPYPPANVRLVTQIAAATTVYMPQYPSDGARITLADTGSTSTALTIDANGRKIEGAAALAFDPVATPQASWFYRADLGDWVRCSALTLSSNSPFPDRYDMLLVTALSMWLCPRNGREPSAVTVKFNGDLLTKFRAQYKQYVPTPATHSLSQIQTGSAAFGFGSDFGFFNG